MERRGIFIVLEGTDRIGKSTQAKLLEDMLTRLYGTETLSVRFPDRSTPLGQSLNTYLNGKLELNPHAVHLLFTANRWERAAEINQALESGRCVVADRYSYSGIVYTAAKEPNPPSWEWCKKTEDCLPQPDLIICLLPASMADLVKRGGFGDERFENADFQSRVMQNYRRLAEEINTEALQAQETERKPRWEWVIASDMTPQQVHDAICEILQTKLTHCPQLHKQPSSQ